MDRDNDGKNVIDHPNDTGDCCCLAESVAPAAGQGHAAATGFAGGGVREKAQEEEKGEIEIKAQAGGSARVVSAKLLQLLLLVSAADGVRKTLQWLDKMFFFFQRRPEFPVIITLPRPFSCRRMMIRNRNEKAKPRPKLPS